MGNGAVLRLGIAFALVALAATIGFVLNRDLSSALLVLVGGGCAVLLAANHGAQPSPSAAPAPTTPAAQPPLPSSTELIEAIGEPVLVVSGARVVQANATARQLLGQHIVGEDVRLAIRHPAAAERLASPDVEDASIQLVGLGTRDQSWELRTRNVGDGRRIVHLADRTGAHAADRIRVDFVANASHELRTPLAAILGFIETLGDEAGDDPAIRRRFLKVMDDEARRMQRLIEDLMSLSRIEAEKYRAPDQPVELAELVAEVRAELAGSGDPRASDLTMSVEPVPPVLGDRAQLSQLLHNIVVNAMKYGRAGTPIVLHIGRAGETAVRLAVTDQGDGVAQEHLPRLTERFYRVDSGRSRAIGGTGLGLAIVKHIVERHRGRLDIASMQGEGTTVTVRLPAAVSHSGNATATQRD